MLVRSVSSISSSATAFFEYSVDLLCIVDFDGLIRQINPAFQSRLGYSEADCIQTEFLDWVHPEDRQNAIAALNSLKKGSSTLDLALRFYGSDGSCRYLQWSGSANLEKGLTYLSAREIPEQNQSVDHSAPFDQVYDSCLVDVPICIFQTDNQGRWVFVNPAWTMMTGLTLQDVAGEGWVEHLHQGDRERVLVEWEQAVTAKAAFCSEYRLVHPNRKMIWVLGKGMPYQNSQGDIAGYMGCLVDITTQKETETALQESNERWQLALSGNNDGIWDWNIRTNELFYSTRWKEMLGYSEPEIENSVEEWSTRVHPDDLPGVMQVLQAHLNQTLPFYASEHRMRCKDGSYRWILCRGQALWDETHSPIRMVGSHRDITARKNLELEQQKLLTILEHAPDFIGIATLDGNVQWLNQSAQNSINCHDPQQFAQYQITDFSPPWAVDLLQSEGLPTALEKGVWMGETALKDCLGREIPVSQLVIAHKNSSGQPEYFSTIMRDISSLKTVEASLKQQLRLTAFRAEITTILAQDQCLLGLLQQSADAIVVHLEAAFARIWLLNPHTNILELKASAGLYTHLNGMHSQIPMGQCKIGLIAQGCTPHLTNNVQADPRVSDQEWAKREGMIAFSGWPLVSSGKTLGVIAVFARQTLDVPKNHALEIASYEIAMVIERHQERKKLETAMKNMNLELEVRVQQRTQELLTAQEVLRTSEEKFRQLAANLKQVFWMNDLQKETMLYVSPAYERIWGKSCDSLYQNPAAWLDDIHPEDRDSVISQLPKQLYADYDVEYRIIRPDGEMRWIHDHSIPIKNEHGEIYRLAGIAEDITERKAAIDALHSLNDKLEKRVKERTLALQQAKEEAEASSRSKSIFLANMSHELRTPLNTILGFSDVLARSSNLSESQYENIRIISRSGAHLITLINDVLDLSKLEAGRTTFMAKAFDLKQLLRDVRDMFGQIAQEKGITLSTEIEPELIQYIQTDEIKLRQVLINLLSNALKFTATGSVVLGVKHELKVLNPQSPLPQVNLEFSVEDTGIGIPPAEIDTIFNAFEQTQAGQNFQGGTGLGLTISKGFVEVLGGALTVRSQVGQGSCFQFSIPVEVVLACPIGARLYSEMDSLSSQPSTDSHDAYTSQPSLRLPMGHDDAQDSSLALSKEMIQALKQAAIEGDLEGMTALIEKIRVNHPKLAEYLFILANQFQFEFILKSLRTDEKP